MVFEIPRIATAGACEGGCARLPRDRRPTREVREAPGRGTRSGGTTLGLAIAPTGQLTLPSHTSTDTGPTRDNESDPGTDDATDLCTLNALVRPVARPFPQVTRRRVPADRPTATPHMWSRVVCLCPRPRPDLKKGASAGDQHLPDVHLRGAAYRTRADVYALREPRRRVQGGPLKTIGAGQSSGAHLGEGRQTPLD